MGLASFNRARRRAADKEAVLSGEKLSADAKAAEKQVAKSKEEAASSVPIYRESKPEEAEEQVAISKEEALSAKEEDPEARADAEEAEEQVAVSKHEANPDDTFTADKSPLYDEKPNGTDIPAEEKPLESDDDAKEYVADSKSADAKSEDVAKPDDGLDSMTKPELEAYAKERGIELDLRKKKETLVSEIRAS